MPQLSLMHDAWKNNRTALGAWLFLREPAFAEAASRSGYDYVCIDLQHGLATFDKLSELLQAISCGEATPIVRAPWNEPWMIGAALDAGALGVIVPMINSAEEAKRAVAACRYAPSGSRSIGPVGAMIRFGTSYLQQANTRVLCIVMIETATAIGNLEEILAVPGVDAVYVGPADLSLTLDLPPGLDSAAPQFTDALEAVIDCCERHKVVPGIHSNSTLASKRHDAGFRMISVSYDQQPLLESLNRDLDVARKGIGSAS